MRKTVLVLFVLLLIAGCTKKETPETVKPSVSVSIMPLKYFTERIGGDRYQINVLLPPGANPHTFEPQPSVLRSLSESSALFIIGELEFEKAWLERFRSVNKDIKIVVTSEGVDFISHKGCDHNDKKDIHDHHHDHRQDHHHEGIDPHIWMSPSEVSIIAQNIFDHFSSYDPDGKDFYQKNLDEFLKDLNKLDMQIKTMTKDIETRKFIIYHPALSYFARDYNLKEIAIEIDGKEPSPKQIMNLIKTAKEHNIRTVFTQKQFDTRTSEVIAEEIGGAIAELDPLSEDWFKNMITIARTIQLSKK